MEKIVFENLPNTNTPIDAENLNKLQDNVEEEFNNINTDVTNAENSIGDLSNLNTTKKTNLVDAVNEVNTKNFLTAIPTQQTINGTDVFVSFSKVDKRSLGDKLTIENGKIKIGEDVSLIKIDLKIGGQVGANAISGTVGGKLRNNGDLIVYGFSGANLPAYGSGEINIPSIIVAVEEGDLIDFVCTATSNFVINSSYSSRSFVTVEVIV